MTAFAELLCAAHDFNRGAPANATDRVTRAEVEEYVDAHTVVCPPDHPTSVLHWDLIRTFGESDGRKLLLAASRRWDAKPLRARDIVFEWWEDDYEPRAWVDEYLTDVIGSWRRERDRLQLCSDAEKAWRAFNGSATQAQIVDWQEKYGDWYPQPQKKIGPVKVIVAAVSTPPRKKRALADYHLHVPSGKFINAQSGTMVNAETLNRMFEKTNDVLPATLIARSDNVVDDMTWSPSDPQFIHGRVLERDGWVEQEGAVIYNTYREPTFKARAGDASPFVDLVKYLFPNDGQHVVSFLAFVAQNPGVKINHALVLGSEDEGIGKDSILLPLRYIVGSGNYASVTIDAVAGRFNEFWQSVFVVINEARDTGEASKYAIRNKLKGYLAAPPMAIHIDDKNKPKFFIPNVVNVAITTNYKDALYLADGDRRYFVAWSDRTKADFRSGYFDKYHSWLKGGGYEIVAQYLTHYDVSDFNPKATPPVTEGFLDIVDTSVRHETVELVGILEHLGNPLAVTLADVTNRAPMEFKRWLHDHKNRHQVSHRMREAGYVPVRNSERRKDGLWKVGGRPQVVYARKELSSEQRIAAAEARARK